MPGEPEFSDRWIFHDFLKTPDKRFLEIVRLFSEAGYLEEESDDFY